jgi:hypothetical protein
VDVTHLFPSKQYQVICYISYYFLVTVFQSTLSCIITYSKTCVSGENNSTDHDVNFWNSKRKLYNLKNLLLRQVLQVKTCNKITPSSHMTSSRPLSESRVKEGMWKICALDFSRRHDSIKSSQANSHFKFSNWIKFLSFRYRKP